MNDCEHLTPAFLPWVGSKRILWKKICPLIPEHKLFVENFSGAATVFFQKELAHKNIINDKNEKLIDMFRYVKQHKQPPACKMPSSKEEYQSMYDHGKGWCSDYSRIKCSFASNGSRGFKGTKDCPVDFSTHPTAKNWDVFREKLKHASLYSMDGMKLAKKYQNNKNAFIFTDIPYPGTGKGFYAEGETSVKDVCDFAKHAKAKVMITINDTPQHRKDCDGLHIMPVNGRYKIADGTADNSRAVSKELIIMNYEKGN